MFGSPCFTIPKSPAGGGGGGGGTPAVILAGTTGEEGAICGATVVLSFASTPTNGHLIILVVTDNTGAGPTSFSGFTAVTGGSDQCRVFYKIAASETNSYSYTYNGTSGSDSSILSGVTFSNIFATPFDVSANASNTRTCPSATTTHANDMIFLVGGSHSAHTDFATAPAGFTGIDHPTRNGIGLGTAWKSQATAAATGTNNWNTGSYASAKCFTIGFRTE